MKIFNYPMTIVSTLALCVYLVVQFGGCGPQAPNNSTSSNTSNPYYNVSTLFVDNDGYTVKRFTDGGYDRYYVTRGEQMETTTVESHGKSRTFQTIPTVVR